MPEYSTNEQLMQAIEADMVDIVFEVSQNVVEIIKEQVIDVVYKPYNPSRYKRLYEDKGFLGSWTFKVNSTGKSKYEAEIYSDAESMEYNPDEFQHGGFMNTNKERFKKGNYVAVDRREDMDRIIAEGAKTGEYDLFKPPGDKEHNWWLFERDYWSPVNEELDALNEFENSVMRAFFKMGIDATNI